MARTNPNYVPQPGDIFALKSSSGGSTLLTVVSASRTQFVANDGQAYDTQSGNVSIFSTPNLSAVASAAASSANQGSGAIAGVGVNGPSINLNLRCSDINSAISNANGQPYILSFTSGAAWRVLNAAQAIIASGAYADPTTITFLGISVQISGAPAGGDVFIITPYTGI